MGARREESMGWVEKNQFVLMVVAVLVAGVAYRAIASPPGGFWTRDGPSPQHVEYLVGWPKMAYLSPREYLFHVISNTATYVGSMSIALSLLVRAISIRVSKASEWGHSVTVVPMVMMWFCFCAMSMVFKIALGVAVQASRYGTASHVLLSAVQVWTCLSWFLLPGLFIWRKITR